MAQSFVRTSRIKNGQVTPPRFATSSFTPPRLSFSPVQGVLSIQDLQNSVSNRAANLNTGSIQSDLINGLVSGITAPFTNFLTENKVNIVAGFIGIVLVLIALTEIVKDVKPI